MQDLIHWPVAERADIIGVFTDIDDTLTTDGAITPDALEALAALKGADLKVIPITGRPVGWSEPFALAWPVDAIVAENGAVALHATRSGLPALGSRQRDGAGSAGTSTLDAGRTVLSKLYQQDEATRRANHARMQQVAQRVMQQVPGAVISQDSAGRETDIAIDHSEFVHLPDDRIAQALAIMREEGMNATVSSIHINGWYGDHDKWVGARWIVRTLWNRDLAAEIGRWVYVGDSTNDQVMFEAFPHAVGVANIRRFEAQLQHKPRYVTAGARGAGFSEVVAAVLAARGK